MSGNAGGPTVPPGAAADLEANKQLVRDFLAAFSAGDADGVVASMTDDGTWWTARAGDATSPMPAEAFAERMRSIATVVRGGAIDITPHRFVAEGDAVAVEATSYAELENGRVYENVTHLAFVLRHGLVHEVREYADTEHATAVFRG